MRRWPWRSLLLPSLLLTALGAPPPATHAQQAPPPPPSPEEYLGYALGARFTPAAQIQAYARLLASLSPLVEYLEYGETPEHRTLFQLVLTSTRNRLHLEEALTAQAELADPSTTPDRAREIAATHPAVVYLTYGIHGNEPSPGEAALWTVWDLIHPGADAGFILDSLIVVVDPVANPDGRDRYVQWYHSVAGATPNPDPQSREHREPWPTGRYNHYLFDLNRDWAWVTQPETLARLATWSRWNPVVHVDFHEMAFGSSYFFFPAAAPINPIYPDHVLGWGERFGAANARAFDAHGWAYFTGDEYDLFYPGYGDSWPSLLGAIGMTYEQAGNGAAGLSVRRSTGDTLTLRDRALHHWTAGITTLRTAAEGKTELMLDFASGQRRIGEDAPDVLLVPGQDTLRLAALVEHLRRQGVVMERAAGSFRAEARAHPGFVPRRNFPAGTYHVPARQARGRLATTLLAPAVPLRAESSYDISAWSLPYAYGVEAYQVNTVPDAAWTPATPAGEATPPTPDAAYGYLIPGNLAAASGIVDLLERGIRVRVLSRPATLQGRSWPEGTWFVPVFGNPPLRSALDSAGLGGLTSPIGSGRAEGGIDLGSEHIWPVEAPRVGVLTGDGVLPSSFGAHWFFLERRLGLAFDALLISDLPELDLSDHDVLVMPDLGSGMLKAEWAEELKGWVERGGRLVAVGGGAAAVAPIFEVPVREPLARDSVLPERLLRTRNDRLRGQREEEVAGVILQVRVDGSHPLGWGSGGTGAPPTFVLHNGTLVFDPAAELESVAYFPGELDATSGVISEANLQRLEHGSWLTARSFGKGSVTLFADDPLFRLFWRQTHRFYLNSILVGPRR